MRPGHVREVGDRRRRVFRSWLRHEVTEWNVLAATVVALGVAFTVFNGAWWGLPLGVLGGWVCVVLGRLFHEHMAAEFDDAEARRRRRRR